MSEEFTTQLPIIKPIILGKIGSAYGIRGWLKVFSSTEKAENIFGYQPWFIHDCGKWLRLELESWRYQNRHFIIKVQGINDRDAAAMLTNYEIMVDSTQFIDLNDGDYYWKDLIGCQVFNIDGHKMGKVIDLIETGSNDVIVVEASSRDVFGVQKRLIPFLDGKVIKKVDLVTGFITVDWDPNF
ncbi:ribosome maturation factor RimM [Pantoea sp. Nvir]|uniref:ribosome maturation factor RimM n=1 Tax=Pantoea sp. Nvir TaxID=2576760 RepID=UPI0027FE39B6|nr:ribosome maturation factor RimM [Pantoea sp. Nvir]CAJ0991060.1 Ribosome maturation factor RimM [Pantoea sp. Nvir]